MKEKDATQMEELEHAAEENVRVAAFFDLDGTLIPLPSLERRFLRILRYRREIPLRNYFFWLMETLRLLPRGFCAIAHANKMYLRGVKSFDESDAAENRGEFSARADGSRQLPSQLGASQAGRQVSTPPANRAWRNPRWPVPPFLAKGVERAAWHAVQGHAIVIVSGTLEPLAVHAAQDLETQLGARGLSVKVRVCATRLEEVHGRWTGKIIGQAMFGKAKAPAMQKLAEELRLDLAQCYAYGDSVNDRWLLAAAGNPAAVNPSNSLGRIAQKKNWPVLRWDKERNLTPRHRDRREEEPKEEKATIEFCLGQSSRELRKRLRCTERCV